MPYKLGKGGDIVKERKVKLLAATKLENPNPSVYSSVENAKKKHWGNRFMTQKQMRTRKKPKEPGPFEVLMGDHLRELGFVHLEFGYKFYSNRRWTSDVAIMDCRVLIECDGGMWSGGHKRGTALEDDYEKQNIAQMLGWRILRFTNRQVENGEAKEFMKNWVG
jgi:very-short-patch-repair endonuclease